MLQPGAALFSRRSCFRVVLGRNMIADHAFASDKRRAFGRHYRYLPEGSDMATTNREGRIVETPTEARQAEPGPSVLALLTISTALAVPILGIVWFVFFRT